MSINKNIDIKEKKLLIPQMLKEEKVKENQKENINKKMIPKITNPEYQINISKINSKSEKINNEKTYKNNYLKVEGGKESNNGSKKLVNRDFQLEQKIDNIKVESFIKPKEEKNSKMNNLEKFNLGINKNASNSRNNNPSSLGKNFKSDEKRDADEEQILILNTNKFEFNSNPNNRLNGITNKNNNYNYEEVANFKTIEIDKYNDKAKEIERIRSINNSYVNNNKIRKSEKSNLKDKKLFKEKNDEEEFNRNRVYFKGNSNSRQSSKLELERNKRKELKSKKTLLSIDIFKSKGDANIRDQNYKRDTKHIEKIVTSEFISKKSALLAAENLKIHNTNNYFRKLSPIKIKKSSNIEVTKQTEFILLRTEKEDKVKENNVKEAKVKHKNNTDSCDEKLNGKYRNNQPLIRLINEKSNPSEKASAEPDKEEDEAKQYFLNSKEKRKINKQFTGFEDHEQHNKINNKSNEEDFDIYSTARIIEPKEVIKDSSLITENSIFYKNNYFKDDLFKVKNQKKGDFLKNKEELTIQEKLMYYYLNPRNYTAMPKFMKISTREKKCHEIMQYQESQIPERLRQFYDPYPCLKLRKRFFKFFETIKIYMKIVKHPIFDNISLIIILVNTLFILISDPTDQLSIANTTDQYFLYLFSIEMFLKFLAYGVIIPPNSYFRDYWNILDFMVVAVGWISFVIENSFGGQKISGLAGLRAFRILRPLKTIKSIMGLRRIIGTLLESMLALGDIVIVLFFFFLIFAIAGLQMWSGLLLRRCHSSIYGYRLPLNDYQNMCTSDSDCAKYNRAGERFYCAVTDQNPNTNVTHYDNLVNGLITVFIIATMEGWTDIFNYISNTFKDDFKINAAIIFFYFHVLLFVGGYYLINLYLAVINTKYAEIEMRNRKSTKKENLSLYSILMETFNNTDQDAEGNKENHINENNPNNKTKEELDEEEMANLNEEQKIKKIKDEVNFFEDNPNEFPVSYEVLNDIFTLRTFTAKELYDLRSKVLKEANKALQEFKIIYKERKRSEKQLKESNRNKHLSKKLMRSTTTLIKDEIKSFKNQSMLRKRNNIKREESHFGYTDNQILDEIVPLSIIKTIEKFEDDIAKSNLEVEKKNKTKRINQERKKQKIQQILNKKIQIDKEKEPRDSSESDSNSSENELKAEDEKNKNDGKEKDKKANFNSSNPIEKKATGLTDKKTTDDDDQKNEEPHDLTFSINTSDDSSYSFGYINESVDKEKEIGNFDKDGNKNNLAPDIGINFNAYDNGKNNNNNDMERKINEKFKEKIKEKYTKKDSEDGKLNENLNAIAFKNNNRNKNESENLNEEDYENNLILKSNKSPSNNNKNENYINNINKNNDNKGKNILVKKTLVDEENDLYNKMIVVKPENPMIILPKYKEENIIKRKKNLWRSIAKASDMIDENFQAVFKGKLRRDTSFLDFLKNTEAAGQKYRQITVDEIRNYENELEDQSLDISAEANDPALIIAEKSEMEILNSLSQVDANDSLDAENKKIEEFNILNERLDENHFQNNIKNSINDKRKAKRNTLNALEGNNINLMKKIKKLDLLYEFNGTSIDTLNKLNNVISSNSSRNKEDHNSIPVNNNMFMSSTKVGQMNNNMGLMKLKESSTNNKKLNNLNLFKYDNDMIMRLDLKLATNKKLGKKRAFSIKRNEMKFAFIETNIDYNNNDKSNTVGVSKGNSANSLINLGDKDRPNNKKQLVKNINPLDNLRRKEKDHLQNYRKYMKYLNFIVNKDFAVIDDFSVDDFLTDVMGKVENVHLKSKRNLELDPIKIFNLKNLNLKTNSSIKYKVIPIIDSDLVEVKNNLKRLPLSILSDMDSKTKDFRFINLKDKFNNQKLSRTITVDGNTNNAYSSKRNVDKYSQTRTQTTGVSTLHRSQSMISNSSSGLVKKDVLKEIHMNIEKNIARAYQDYFHLSTKLKIKQFFEKDKFQRTNENDKNKNIAIIKIEVDLNKEDIKNKIEKIRNYDTETNTVKYKEWSAQQVMNWEEDCNKYEEWNSLISELEQVNVILWGKNSCLKLILKRIRYMFFKLSTNLFFEGFILFIVIFNILTMLLAGNLFSVESQDVIKFLNLGFNIIFIFEFVCKFIGLGPIIYFSDAFTYLDLLIIALAVLDLTNLNVDDIQTISNQKNKSLTSQFAFFKVFRIFRVLRIAKILRRIKSFRKILVGIRNSLKNVAYNSLILLIFLVIFQLLGMSFLSQDENYQSFFSSLFITFQLLTIENWNSVLFKLSEFNRLSVLYLVALIFIGNYILFNLFISILLNSFDSTSMADISNEESEDFQKLPEEFAKYERMQIELKSMSRRSKTESKSKVSAISAAEISDDSDTELTQSMSGNENMIKTSFTQFIGVKKFIKDRTAVNKIFNNNECEYSLYLFSQTSKIRLFCKNIVSLKKFDTFILYMILLSTFRLIIDTFLNGSTSAIVFDMVDVFFTMVFLFEMVFKIIALGFVLDEGSYLKDNWNRIDFVIVTVSIIDLQNLISKYTGSVSSSSLNFLKVLRLLRTLRPLRFISHNVQLKIIITALLDSIGPIANVLIIVFIILLVFSIVGMTLFYELYHTCYRSSTNTPYAPILNFTDYVNFTNPEDYNKIEKLQDMCNSLGGTYDATPSFKFSNLFTSLITSYVLSNGEGWSDVMNSYRAFNELYGLFFIFFFLIVTNFFFNLFVGVMFSSFNDAWNKEHKKEITENSSIEQYWDFLKQIEIAVPEWSTFKTPDKGLRKHIYILMQSKFVDNFIILIILMNMMTMAVDFQGSSPSFTENLDTLNLVFTTIFILECFLKIVANGFSGYFYYGWNKFDFFVVSSSIVDLVMKNTNQAKVDFLKSFQIIRVLRVLRVTRVLRLVKSLRGLEKLLQTLRWSINALMNVFILMFLIFCIFAIIGCYLFNGITFQGNEDKFAYYNQYFNFDNFYNSFLLCFRSVTGENWPLMMIEISIVGKSIVDPYTSYLYFIIMNFITYIIMLNLFLLVTLQQYEDFSRKENNPIEKFSELLNNFKHAWNKYSTESDNGYRIKNENMTNFLMDLEGEIMRKKKKRIDLLKKYIMDLGLLNDEQNYVYFQDVLFKLIKHEFGKDIDQKKNKLIVKEEEKLIKSIKTKIDNFIKTTKTSREKIYNNPLNTFNPLTSHLYYKNSFKYIKYFLKCYVDTVEEKKIEKLNYQNENEDMNFLENHNKLLLKNKGKKKGVLVGDRLEVLDNFGENLDKYVHQLQLSKRTQSRNEDKLIGLNSGDSEKNNENYQAGSEDVNTDREQKSGD